MGVFLGALSRADETLHTSARRGASRARRSASASRGACKAMRGCSRSFWPLSSRSGRRSSSCGHANVDISRPINHARASSRDRGCLREAAARSSRSGLSPRPARSRNSRVNPGSSGQVCRAPWPNGHAPSQLTTLHHPPGSPPATTWYHPASMVTRPSDCARQAQPSLRHDLAPTRRS